MNKKFMRALAFLMVLLLATGPVGFSANFKDISNHWAKDSITTWADRGVVNGKSASVFAPDSNVTRGEFAKMINKAFGFSKGTSRNYSDVAGKWYANEASIAKAAGYYAWLNSNTFNGDSALTRQEVMAILVSVMEYPLTDDYSVIRRFADYSSLNSKFGSYVATAVEHGITKGVQENGKYYLKPFDSVTRAQAMTMLDRVAGEYANEAGVVYGGTKEKITGNFTVTKGNVTVSNKIITGDMHIAAGVGEGDVTLYNVEVQGQLTIRGGGNNSVKLKGVTAQKMLVDKTAGSVRVLAQGDTNIQETRVKSSVRLEEYSISGDGFNSVVLEENYANPRVVLNGDFTRVETNAEGTLEIESGAKIAELSMPVAVDISSAGTISKIVVEKNTTLSGKYENVEVKNGVNLTLSSGATVKSLKVAKTASGAKVVVSAGANVTTLTSYARADIQANGKITQLNVSSSGVTVKEATASKNVQKLTLSGSYTASMNNKTVKQSFTNYYDSSTYTQGQGLFVSVNGVGTALTTINSGTPAKAYASYQETKTSPINNIIWTITAGSGVQLINTNNVTGDFTPVGTGYVTLHAIESSGQNRIGTKSIKVTGGNTLGQGTKISSIVISSPYGNNITAAGGALQLSAQAYNGAVVVNNQINWRIVKYSSGVTSPSIVNGRLTAAGNGKLLIEAYATDGSGALTQKVFTVGNYNLSTDYQVQNITIAGADSVAVGSYSNYTAAILPATATNKNVTWSVHPLDGSVSNYTINQATGQFMAQGSGRVLIVAAATDGSGVVAKKPVSVGNYTYNGNVNNNGDFTGHGIVVSPVNGYSNILPSTGGGIQFQVYQNGVNQNTNSFTWQITNINGAIANNSLININSAGYLTAINGSQGTYIVKAIANGGVQYGAKTVYVGTNSNSTNTGVTIAARQGFTTNLTTNGGQVQFDVKINGTAYSPEAFNWTVTTTTGGSVNKANINSSGLLNVLPSSDTFLVKAVSKTNAALQGTITVKSGTGVNTGSAGSAYGYTIDAANGYSLNIPSNTGQAQVQVKYNGGYQSQQAYNWTITNLQGSYQSGLNINQNGVITAVNVVAGTYVIRATNKYNSTQYATRNITIGLGNSNINGSEVTNLGVILSANSNTVGIQGDTLNFSVNYYGVAKSPSEFNWVVTKLDGTTAPYVSINSTTGQIVFPAGDASYVVKAIYKTDVNRYGTKIIRVGNGGVSTALNIKAYDNNNIIYRSTGGKQFYAYYNNQMVSGNMLTWTITNNTAGASMSANNGYLNVTRNGYVTLQAYYNGTYSNQLTIQVY